MKNFWGGGNIPGLPSFVGPRPRPNLDPESTTPSVHDEVTLLIHDEVYQFGGVNLEFIVKINFKKIINGIKKITTSKKFSINTNYDEITVLKISFTDKFLDSILNTIEILTLNVIWN